MKIKGELIVCLSLAIILSACYAPKTPDVKDINPYSNIDPKTVLIQSTLYTCNKSDAELSLSELDPNETVIVKDSIENKEIIEVDCENKQTAKGRGPVRELNQFITIEAPIDLSEKVNYAQIENSRTCAIQNIDAEEDTFLKEPKIEADDQPPIILHQLVSTTLEFSGKLKILLSDSTFKLSSLYLNVHDNNNVIIIKYFGKCLKYKDKVYDNLGDSYNCAEAELLGKKQFLLSALIERPEAEGSKINNICVK
ncbi:MAG: hypothetical protein WA160_04495 [Pseudobdellovibrio sp.]